MSNPRAWIIRKLREDAALNGGSNDSPPKVVGAHGLRVVRKARPDALIYCAGLRQNETFGLEDLDRALSELRGVQFVVVVPTRIAHAVYPRAEDLGLCVDGFAELAAALRDDDDVSRHRRREQAYVMRRLRARRVVRSVRRRGLSAYEIERANLPSLTIVTSDDYELTADGVYSLLESYSSLDVDAVVITNPNVRGLSSDSLRAGNEPASASSCSATCSMFSVSDGPEGEVAAVRRAVSAGRTLRGSGGLGLWLGSSTG